MSGIHTVPSSTRLKYYLESKPNSCSFSHFHAVCLSIYLYLFIYLPIYLPTSLPFLISLHICSCTGTHTHTCPYLCTYTNLLYKVGPFAQICYSCFMNNWNMFSYLTIIFPKKQNMKDLRLGELFPPTFLNLKKNYLCVCAVCMYLWICLYHDTRVQFWTQLSRSSSLLYHGFGDQTEVASLQWQVPCTH